VNGSAVYWASVDWESDAGPSGWGSVQTVSTDGGAVTILGMAVLPNGVAVAGNTLYWTSIDSDGGGNTTLWATPLDGGATTTLVIGVPQARKLAVDSTSVYWSTVRPAVPQVPPVKEPDGAIPFIDPGGPAIMKLALGGGVPTVVTTFQDNLDGLTADGANVYFVTHAFDANNVPHGAVEKVSIAGGDAVILASATLPSAREAARPIEALDRAQALGVTEILCWMLAEPSARRCRESSRPRLESGQRGRGRVAGPERVASASVTYLLDEAGNHSALAPYLAHARL